MNQYKAKYLELLQKKHKYNAVPLVVDGIRFASSKEAHCYKDLKLLEKVGKIRNLELQPVFEITILGQHVCDYRADFKYLDDLGNTYVVDVKGIKTPLYKLKKKLVQIVLGVEILEI